MRSAMAFDPGGEIVFLKPHQPADPDRCGAFAAGEQVIDGADMTLHLGGEVLFGQQRHRRPVPVVCRVSTGLYLHQAPTTTQSWPVGLANIFAGLASSPAATAK